LSFFLPVIFNIPPNLMRSMSHAVLLLDTFHCELTAEVVMVF
jgi:hypothetical protein